MTVAYGDVFDAAAEAAKPDDVAIYCDERTVLWGEFDRTSNALARNLLAAGLPTGAKVAQYMRNSPEYLEAFAAAFKARLAPVNVNFRYGPDEVEYLIDNSDAEAVFFDAEFIDVVRAVRPKLPRVKLWCIVHGEAEGFTPFADLAEGDGAPLGIERSPDDMFLMYTGGTTGMPKGVMWPSGTWWPVLAGFRSPSFGAEAPTTLEALKAQIRSGVGREPVYVAVPLMHGTGLFTAVSILTKAAPVVITQKASFDPKAALDTVTRLRCSGFVIVGDAFARPMVDALRAEPERYDVTCLEVVVSSGMMWSPEVKTGMLEFMPNAMLVDSFGASEGAGIGISVSSRDLPPTEARFDAGDTIVVRESDFTPIEPGSGEIGLCAKLGDLPLGYYKDPEKSARTWVTINGQRRLISGDHATVEADGTIKLLGRGSHCINSGGEKIYPEEVEEALKTHPAVHDALVFGMPDERFGQVVSAVVGLAPGQAARDAELMAHVRGKLAPYKAPRKIVFVPQAPRAPNGKADYATAKRLFEQAMA
ncbi:MAG TPA: AMP-binding protein [Caulobacteraceae bacterium]|nr:AMP-binding protein [Caulobacteraceae bacterium]